MEKINLKMPGRRKAFIVIPRGLHLLADVVDTVVII